MLGLVLALTILALVAVPLASAAIETIEFLNPMGNIEALANQPLAAREWTSFNNKNIALAYYTKAANKEALVAISELLPGGVVAEIPISGTTGALTGSEYDTLAGYDAVILGVADEAVCAFWSVYHAKQLESRGVPTVVVTTSAYDSANKYAVLDNGFVVRFATIDRAKYSKAYANLGTFADGVAYMKANVVAGDVLAQTLDALTLPLTEAEVNPPVITSVDLGVPGWETSSVTGTSYDKAFQAFNQFAVDNGFDDGLPLIPPTRPLVDDMLSATERSGDEILGKMMPRGGIITVEKVAINSVMAGLAPKSFPAVLAVLEAYASGWETNKMFYHSLTTGSGNYTMMLILSGPYAKDIGVAGDRGLGASGFDVNATIGRAVKLCVRNIGHTAEIDESNRSGRENDHSLYVFREQDELLPPGWETHSELMGFPEGSSTITLQSYWVTQEWYGGDTFGYDTAGVLGHLRNGMYKDGKDKDLAIVWILPGMAWDLYDTLGMSSKEEMRDHMMTLGVNTAPGGSAQYETAAPYGLSNIPDARIADRQLIMPIVAGGDPGYTRLYTGTNYGTSGFQTQLIAEKGDLIAPSAPQDFNVSVNRLGTAATLSWTEPERADNLVKYQVSKDDGRTWVDVDLETQTYTFEDLTPGGQYFFVARAVNAVKNSADIVKTGDTMGVNNSTSGNGSWASMVVIAKRTAPTAMRIGGAAIVTVRKNAALQLTVTVSPADSDPSVVWSSSNPAIASVDENGLVTAIKTGTVIITARTVGDEITSIVTIRVIA